MAEIRLELSDEQMQSLVTVAHMRLRDELDQTKRELGQKEGAFAELRKLLKVQDDQLNELKEALRYKGEEVKKWTNEAANNAYKTDMMRKERDEARRECGGLTADKNILAAQRDTIRHERDKMKEANKQLRELHGAETRDLREALRSISEECSQLAHFGGKYREQRDNLRDKARDLLAILEGVPDYVKATFRITTGRLASFCILADWQPKPVPITEPSRKVVTDTSGPQPQTEAMRNEYAEYEPPQGVQFDISNVPADGQPHPVQAEPVGTIYGEPVNEKAADLRPFSQTLAGILNRHSQENGSNTPDFILAEFMAGCLDKFNLAVRERDRWYSVQLAPAGGTRYFAPASTLRDVMKQLCNLPLAALLQALNELPREEAGAIMDGLRAYSAELANQRKKGK
jgi:hypothetical protein